MEDPRRPYEKDKKYIILNLIQDDIFDEIPASARMTHLIRINATPP